MNFIFKNFTKATRKELDDEIYNFEENAFKDYDEMETQLLLINEKIEFAFKINLINCIEFQEYQFKVQITYEKKINDDIYTAKERLFDMRNQGKKNLMEWRKKVHSIRNNDDNNAIDELKDHKREKGERNELS